MSLDAGNGNPSLESFDSTDALFRDPTFDENDADFGETSFEEPEPKKYRLSVLPLLSVLIFAVVYAIPIMPLNPAEHSVLAILLTCLYLWATDCIPAYATAYAVPVLGCWFGVGIDPVTHLRMSARDISTVFAHAYMDNVVFVFLGSMTIGAGLAKLNITDRVTRFVFKHLSRRPAFILLTLMMLNVIISAFLSSAAATTIILQCTLPIIRSLDPDDGFIRSLLYGLAWSGSCGAISTTIASPPNLLALKFLDELEDTTISLPMWAGFGIPIALVVCVIEWAYLSIMFKPFHHSIDLIPPEPVYTPWHLKHTAACVIMIVTIILWSIQEQLPHVLGNIGITSLLPVITFFGSGILTVKDFNELRWNSLSLMGGGLCIGEAMRRSGLLDLINDKSRVFMAEVPLWPTLFVFCLICGAFGSTINSSAAGGIVYPIIGTIGRVSGHPVLFLALSACMIDGSVLFNMSSFSNGLVSGVLKHAPGAPERMTSRPFLKWIDFPKHGWVALSVRTIIVSTVGYGICLGFKY
jgi:phosphate transporter